MHQLKFRFRLMALSSALTIAATCFPQIPDALQNKDPDCKLDLSAPTLQVNVQIADESGAAIPRAAVEARCGADVRSGITAADGQVALNLRSGTYRITARAPGFATIYRHTSVDGTPVSLTLPIAASSDVINVTADTGFVPYESNAGSKTNSLLVEVPQSISIVNQREMEARQVVTVNEALRYTPGIQADEYGVEPRFDWLKIRGFDAQVFGVYRDGMRFNSLAGKLDPFELESVEVLRGPSSVLYGEVPPGGLINQVTKRPGTERRSEFTAQFGSYYRRQGTVDTTGAFDANQKWRYRLLGLVRNSDTQVDYTPDNRRLVSPSLTWHPSDRTNFTILGDYQHDGTRWSQFLPSQGTLNANPNGIIPVSVYVGEPGLDYVRRDQGSIGYTGDHLFSDGWNLHSNYRFQYINFTGRTIYGAGFATGSNTNVNRYGYLINNGDHIHTQDTRAMRRFHSGNWEQTVLFGYDFQHVRLRDINGFGGTTTQNIFRPTYKLTAFPSLFYYLDQNTALKQHGLYAQDQIRYRDHLVFTLGGRQDFAKNDIANFVTADAGYQHLDQRFTGRAGVTYVTSSGFAPYFAFSTSFLPNAGSAIPTNGLGSVSTPAKPSDARQIEGGVKIQPRRTTAFVTASLFQINQTNVIVYNSAFVATQAGEVRSRGLELEGVASLYRGLNLHASYTLLDTSYVKTTPGATAATDPTLGKWLTQTPRNNFSTLFGYTQASGRFSGVGGNFGVRFVGRNAADSLNSFFTPNYTLLDAGLRFGFRHTLFAVNASNLTNQRYVSTCSGADYCYYGYARNVVGSAKYHF